MEVSTFARRLDWNLLRTFRTIVDAGGIGAAARAANLRQPSVSAALRRLEAQLGATLCLRSAQGIVLTEAGRALDAACREMLGLVDGLPGTLRQASARLSGTLAVHMVSDLDLPPLDRAFAAFHDAHEAVEMRIAVAGWRDVQEAVARRAATVGIACMGGDATGFRRHPIGRERQQLFCGPRHRLHGTVHADATGLAGEALVIREDGEAEEVALFRARHGLGRRASATVATLAEARRMIAAGLGIGFLPESLGAAREDGLLGLLPDADLPSYEIVLFTRADLPATDPGAVFVEAVLHALRS